MSNSGHGRKSPWRLLEIKASLDASYQTYIKQNKLYMFTWCQQWNESIRTMETSHTAHWTRVHGTVIETDWQKKTNACVSSSGLVNPGERFSVPGDLPRKMFFAQYLYYRQKAKPSSVQAFHHQTEKQGETVPLTKLTRWYMTEYSWVSLHKLAGRNSTKVITMDNAMKIMVTHKTAVRIWSLWPPGTNTVAGDHTDALRQRHNRQGTFHSKKF